MAVELGGTCTVTVADHPPARAGTEFAHLSGFVFGGQNGGLILAPEGFDFLGDSEVLIGDGAMGDSLWRTQILQLSECLSFAGVGGMVEGSWTGSAAVVGGISWSSRRRRSVARRRRR